MVLLLSSSARNKARRGKGCRLTDKQGQANKKETRSCHGFCSSCRLLVEYRLYANNGGNKSQSVRLCLYLWTSDAGFVSACRLISPYRTVPRLCGSGQVVTVLHLRFQIPVLNKTETRDSLEGHHGCIPNSSFEWMNQHRAMVRRYLGPVTGPNYAAVLARTGT
jgi:hypothetical protein